MKSKMVIISNTNQMYSYDEFVQKVENIIDKDVFDKADENLLIKILYDENIKIEELLEIFNQLSEEKRLKECSYALVKVTRTEDNQIIKEYI